MKTIKSILFKSICFLTLCSSKAIFAAPDSGQLVIVNNLGYVSVTGNPGATTSNIKIQVYDYVDSTKPCTTVANLPYHGVTIVRWSSTGVHSSNFCSGTGSGTPAIYQVKITPLPTTLGRNKPRVVYDAIANLPQANATPITFTPPTVVYGNMALIINGDGTPTTTSGQNADATHWGFTVNPTTPIFDSGNGAVLVTGIPGADSAYGLNIKKLLEKYALIPHDL